jgi:cell division protein ZapE
MSVTALYDDAVRRGDLKEDQAQKRAVEKLDGLAAHLADRPISRLLHPWGREAKGLYIWGQVGRGKTLLMDLFFQDVSIPRKRRAHFNAFMADIHARIHELDQAGTSEDSIRKIAEAFAQDATLLCFDEFQVTDVADAMILGRLFDSLFAGHVTVVLTSNTPPDRLYEGGLNRQLFLPFIASIKDHLEVVEVDGPTDYRAASIVGKSVYFVGRSVAATHKMDAIWKELVGPACAERLVLTVLGRKLVIPRAARSVARFEFPDLCVNPLAATDYLAIAEQFSTVMIDRIPLIGPDMRNEARRFITLIDILYDNHIVLICSAAAEPSGLYLMGDGSEAFQRTTSRLEEMRGQDYIARAHAIRRDGHDRPDNAESCRPPGSKR